MLLMEASLLSHVCRGDGRDLFGADGVTHVSSALHSGVLPLIPRNFVIPKLQSFLLPPCCFLLGSVSLQYNSVCGLRGKAGGTWGHLCASLLPRIIASWLLSKLVCSQGL